MYWSWICGQRAHELVVALRARCVLGAGYQLFRSASWASREKRDGGIVLFGNGWPVCGSMIVVREVAREIVRGRHREERAESPLDPRPFVVEEEERLVACTDRPADDAAELLLIELRLVGGRRVEEVPRVKRFVADEAERGAVEHVRAGLADEVDLVGAEAGTPPSRSSSVP